MLKDVILNYDMPVHNRNYLAGAMLPDAFELPDNILIFMHDWLPRQSYIHTRYMLIIPAVPIEYKIDNDIHYRISPGQAMFSWPCQERLLQPTYGDMDHGYPRLMITFELSCNMFYLPDTLVLNFTARAEQHLLKLIEAYKQNLNCDIAIELFYLLRELSQNSSPAQPIRYSPEIRQALYYINSKPNASLAELAHFAKTSVSNLRLRFKKEMGCPPGEFMTLHRLKIARYHLTNTEMRIDEMAQLCGFASSYAFSHFFKKHTGVSPLAWRKGIRKESL